MTLVKFQNADGVPQTDKVYDFETVPAAGDCLQIGGGPVLRVLNRLWHHPGFCVLTVEHAERASRDTRCPVCHGLNCEQWNRIQRSQQCPIAAARVTELCGYCGTTDHLTESPAGELCRERYLRGG